MNAWVIPAAQRRKVEAAIPAIRSFLERKYPDIFPVSIDIGWEAEHGAAVVTVKPRPGSAARETIIDWSLVESAEYEELPELTDEMVARGTVNRGGRPKSANPKKLISIRLTEDVIQRWRATGPGWQTRMAEKLSRLSPK